VGRRGPGQDLVTLGYAGCVARPAGARTVTERVLTVEATDAIIFDTPVENGAAGGDGAARHRLRPAAGESGSCLSGKWPHGESSTASDPVFPSESTGTVLAFDFGDRRTGVGGTMPALHPRTRSKVSKERVPHASRRSPGWSGVAAPANGGGLPHRDEGSGIPGLRGSSGSRGNSRAVSGFPWRASTTLHFCRAESRVRESPVRVVRRSLARARARFVRAQLILEQYFNDNSGLTPRRCARGSLPS